MSMLSKLTSGNDEKRDGSSWAVSGSRVVRITGLSAIYAPVQRNCQNLRKVLLSTDSHMMYFLIGSVWLSLSGTMRLSATRAELGPIINRRRADEATLWRC